MMANPKRLTLSVLLSTMLVSVYSTSSAQGSTAPATNPSRDSIPAEPVQSSGTGAANGTSGASGGASAETTTGRGLPGGPRPYNMDLGKDAAGAVPETSGSSHPGLTPVPESSGGTSSGTAASGTGTASDTSRSTSTGLSTPPGTSSSGSGASDTGRSAATGLSTPPVSDSAGDASSGASGTSTATSGANPYVSKNVVSDNDDKAIQNLLAAAQRLREAIQTMAQAPVGPQRTAAIQQGNEALMQVQSAMVTLPPDLLTANAKEGEYTKAADKLKQASDRLHGAVQALAQEPAGKRRNEAMKKVNQALMETNQTMINAQMYASK